VAGAVVCGLGKAGESRGVEKKRESMTTERLAAKKEEEMTIRVKRNFYLWLK
jgi:hypothetical protein